MNYKYEIKRTNQFRREFEKLKKRHLNMDKIKDIIISLAKGEELPKANRDHALQGKWIGYRECHIEPDWILIYKVQQQELILSLVRTETHADLF